MWTGSPIRAYGYPWRDLYWAARVIAEGYHFVMCLILGWLGFLLLLPGSTFAVSPGWRIAAEALPENVWGVLFLTGSMIGFAGYLFSKWVWKIAASCAVCSAHLGTAGMVVLSERLSPGSGVYAIIALAGYALVWLQILGRQK